MTSPESNGWLGKSVFDLLSCHEPTDGRLYPWTAKGNKFSNASHRWSREA